MDRWNMGKVVGSNPVGLLSGAREEKRLPSSLTLRTPPPITRGSRAFLSHISPNAAREEAIYGRGRGRSRARAPRRLSSGSKEPAQVGLAAHPHNPPMPPGIMHDSACVCHNPSSPT
jgi:hypothetical protein